MLLKQGDLSFALKQTSSFTPGCVSEWLHSPGTGLRMRTRAPALLLLILLLFSCAGAPELRDGAPEWFNSPPQDSISEYAFRGVGDSDTLAAARTEAVTNLNNAVLDAMNLGDPESWNSEGRSVVKDFSDRMEQVVRNPDTASMAGLVVARRDGWYNDSGSITWAVDILWDKATFDEWTIRLSDATGIASQRFRNFQELAVEAEEDGNVYEAALLWAAAAGVAEEDGNSSAYRLALKGIESAMGRIEYSVEAVPAEALVGLRPSGAVVFNAAAGDRPAADAEFVITYPRTSRDGSPASGEARISSDAQGNVRFFQPEIAFAGTQNITIAPSARPFLEFLDDPANRQTDDFIASLETPAAQAEYEALTRIRTIPMGILILETDLAGNPLDSDTAARGLLAALEEDGFDVEVMDLDPREMISRSERALLRDIKADERISSRYERVLHARVSLESFQQDGDAYNVRVTGSLAMSDVDRQVTLFRTEVSKSSRASSSQQAISAAFRQLGRTFAEELIAQAP